MVGAHIYIRVSSEGQISLPGHTSLDVQERECREYCEQHGIPILGVWSEVGSARDMDKLRVQKAMIRHLRGGEMIIFHNITRFSRNTFQGLNLINKLWKTKNVRIYSVSEDCSYEGTAKRHLFRTTLSVAENESDLISDRVRASLAYRRSIGAAIGNPKYGKMAVYDRDGVRRFVENPQEMRVIDTILQKYYDGVECSDISNYLNENRIRKRHREWTPEMVNYILDQFEHIRTRSMLQAIQDIEEYASDSSSDEDEEQQPIAKRVKRDIRKRSRSRSRSPARRRGEPLRFKKDRKQQGGSQQ